MAWVTPAKPARPGRPAIPSVRVPASQTTPVNRKSIAVSGDNYTLTIDDVIVDDGGDYTCEGSVNSAVFTLQVDCKSKFCIIKSTHAKLSDKKSSPKLVLRSKWHSSPRFPRSLMISG